MIEYQSQIIECADGYPLHARIYGQLKGNEKALLIAGATGVPQRYYKRFAEKMMEKGFSIVTFDFRGISESKHERLRGFKASFLDWAFKDLVAMMDWIKQQAKPLVIGHSFGGHAFGLLENSNQTLGLCTFGTGAGWHGYMPKVEQFKVLFMWHILGPLLTPIYNYLPSKLVGIGENLPLDVYRQWKRWCSFSNYWFDDPQRNFQEQFSNIRVPVTAINSIDDLWAPPSSASAFMKHYDETTLEYITIEPGDRGLSQIGHMGYFHTNCLDWTSEIVEKTWMSYKS